MTQENEEPEDGPRPFPPGIDFDEEWARYLSHLKHEHETESAIIEGALESARQLARQALRGVFVANAGGLLALPTYWAIFRLPNNAISPLIGAFSASAYWFFFGVVSAIGAVVLGYIGERLVAHSLELNLHAGMRRAATRYLTRLDRLDLDEKGRAERDDRHHRRLRMVAELFLSLALLAGLGSLAFLCLGGLEAVEVFENSIAKMGGSKP